MGTTERQNEAGNRSSSAPNDTMKRALCEFLATMDASRPRSPADDVEDDELTHRVIGCAIRVHRALGCGLLESAYEECLCHELTLAKLSIARHITLPIIYDGIAIDAAYKPDLIIENELIVELKTVKEFLPVHSAQLLTYLRLTGITRGLLMNFHVTQLINGIKRIVLTHPRTPHRSP